MAFTKQRAMDLDMRVILADLDCDLEDIRGQQGRLADVYDRDPTQYGAAQAFKSAGRATPLIIMGNRQDELTWWKEQKDANGYETMSVSIAPGVSTLALWVAQQILDGQQVPKDLTVPFLRIDQQNLEANLANTEKGGVANVEYTLEDAKKVISKASM